ncbi:MAG: TauD/TfdA family dioxygenase [Candidatus Puniceispirillum sp.]
MNVTDLSALIGAEISDVDLAKPLNAADIDFIRECWNKNLVLRFRGQTLSDDDLLRFSRYFGELDPPGPNPYGVTFLPDYPEINVISNVKDDTGTPIGNLGDGEAVWHADMTYIDNPPEAGILYAIEVPVGQGHTFFANMVAACAELPAELRARAEGRILIHDAAHNSAGMLRKGYDEVTDVTQTPGARHPLIYRDARGRESLFLGRRPHAYVMGLEVADSDSLLDALWAHATQAKFSWHNEWQPGDVVMWQNRMVLHRRDAFDPAARRIMHRTQIKGASPIAA